MNLLALAMAGLPPYGVHVYVRDTINGLPNVRGYFVNAERSDATEQARALQGQGKQVWYWIGPEATRHYNWRQGLDLLFRKVNETRSEGILVNPERNRNTGGWVVPDAREEMARFGAACGQAAADTRVGMVSYFSHPGVAEFAAAAGDRVWGSVELYGHQETNPAEWERQYRGWQAWFGSTRLVPSVSGWTGSGGGQGTLEGYRAYLSACPKALGAIAFLGAGRVPPHIVTGLESYEPGGSALATLALWLVAAAGRPAGLATIGIAVAVLAFVLTAVGYVV